MNVSGGLSPPKAPHVLAQTSAAQTSPAAAVPPTPQQRADRARADLAAAFATFLSAPIASDKADLVLDHCVDKLTPAIDFGKDGAVCALMSALPMGGWIAIHEYVKAKHGRGAHTVAMGPSCMGRKAVLGLTVFDEMEHLHFVAYEGYIKDPFVSAAQALRSIDLVPLSANRRLKEVHADGRRTTASWVIQAPRSFFVKGTTGLSLGKVKVQYCFDDGTKDGEAVPLDGQLQHSQPKDALAMRAAALSTCTLEEFDQARQAALAMRNTKASFRTAGYVVPRSVSHIGNPEWRGKIACRHMRYQWLLDRREHHLAKRAARLRAAPPGAAAASRAAGVPHPFSFRNYLDEDTLSRHVLLDTDWADMDVKMTTPEVLCHTDELGKSIEELCGPMRAGDVALFALTSDVHGMSLELQVKEEEDTSGVRRNRYVLSFYDPNSSATQVRMSTFDPATFRNLLFSDLVPQPEKLASYFLPPAAADATRRNLSIHRVFDLPADGIARPAARIQTRLAPAFERTRDCMRACLQWNRHEEVAQAIEAIFARWEAQPGRKSLRTLEANLSSFEGRMDALADAMKLNCAEAVKTYAEKILECAKRAGLSKDAVTRLLPEAAGTFVLTTLERYGSTGAADAAHSYLAAILGADPALIPMSRLKGYAAGNEFRGLKLKAFAQIGLKKVPARHGELHMRAAQAVGARLCAIVESKLPDRDKATLIGKLGKSPRAILAALEEEARANPDGGARKWIERAMAHARPSVFGRATASSLQREFSRYSAPSA
jgi:hypothetical protein